MTMWYKPDMENGGAPFLTKNDWADHEGMVEALVDECMDRLRVEFDGDFEGFDEWMRGLEREDYDINWGSSPSVEQRMYNWCWALCTSLEVNGDEHFPVDAAAGEVVDWEEMSLMMIFEPLSFDAYDNHDLT